MLFKQLSHEKYVKFQIPKRAGGVRDICAPVGAMKAAQRSLASLLIDCRTEIEGDEPRKPLSHAFRKNLSIITNAHNHTSRRYVLNVDLADFFPTFNFGRVRGFFIKDKDFALDPKVATVIAQIACFENALPQGSPCSPIIADLIAHILDRRLVALAKEQRATYSRYADDLSFSTNQKSFPEALATPDAATAGAWVAGEELVKIVEKSGFKVNPAKTRMQFKGSRQIVTGLTVNAKVNVSQHDWRKLRSMCRSLYDKGSYHLPLTGPAASAPAAAPPVAITSLEPLAGMLSHVHHVKRESRRFPKEGDTETVFGQTDHARFWFYRFFVALLRPLVVCEGPTDSIYLRNAIRRLTAYQPKLGAVTPDGFKSTVSFFSYENRVHKLLGLTGGFAPQLSFIHGYRRALTAYKHKPLAAPVILLMDNDGALAPKTCNALNKHFGCDVSHASTEPFFHLTDNLYLVKTPHVTGDQSCIEDMFDAATKALPLGGKTFHPEGNGFDSAKHYGKVPFAKKVVEAKADTIVWDGFAPLLDRIVAVTEHYDVALAAKASASAVGSAAGPAVA